MEIVWLGHACFRIRAKEATVISDPCGRATGYSMGRPTADVITISNPDPAHSYAAGVAGSARVIDGAGEFEISGASISGVSTALKPDAKGNGARNVAFVIEVEDLRVCHLGGIGAVPTSDQVEQMSGVDVLLVPVGGGCSLDAPPAAETVSLLEPKIVIPMHYQTDVEKMRLDPLDRFLKEMGLKMPEVHAKLAVTRSLLPGETQVIVLDYKR